jgi:hypothetical protein
MMLAVIVVSPAHPLVLTVSHDVPAANPFVMTACRRLALHTKPCAQTFRHTARDVAGSRRGAPGRAPSQVQRLSRRDQDFISRLPQQTLRALLWRGPPLVARSAASTIDAVGA